MKLIVGLGNPGPKYETTRHNAGFLAVDRLIDRWSAQGPGQGHHAEIWETKVAGQSTLIVKPQTYMNESGKSVGSIFNFYKCTPTDLLVIHDEVDLPPLKIRIKTGGGSAGHNGLRSIDASLGVGRNGYHRIRIGVGKSQLPTEAHVLSPFSDEELEKIDPVLDDITKATELILVGAIKKAQELFNRSTPGDSQDA